MWTMLILRKNYRVGFFLIVPLSDETETGFSLFLIKAICSCNRSPEIEKHSYFCALINYAVFPFLHAIAIEYVPTLFCPYI
jgi:hypothetical protein